MEWSGNFLRKPEFRENSGSNQNLNGLRYVKPEIFTWQLFQNIIYYILFQLRMCAKAVVKPDHHPQCKFKTTTVTNYPNS